jgi:hypothetical protein
MMGISDATSGFKALANRVDLPYVCQNEDDKFAHGKPFDAVIGALVRCDYNTKTMG